MIKFFSTLTASLVLGLIPSIVAAATLFLNPSSGQTQIGQTLTATVRVNAAGTAINAAEATVTFPSDLFKLVSVSKSGSIFKFWTVEPSGSNSSARITFSGGLPNPGYAGGAGTIIKMTWQARTAGTANLKISGGRVLANDGLGTNVLTGQSGATYTIISATNTPPTTTPISVRPVTPTVSSPDFSSQQQWYAGAQATVNWSQPSGLQGVSYSVTREAGTVPDETPEVNAGTTTVSLTEDGVWYFHLRAKYESGWSDVAHFKLQRDATPPAPFEITLTRDRGLADPSPILTFTALDQLSGVTGYGARVNESSSVPVTSPYTITTNQAGEYHVIIAATDGAGNSRESDISFSVEGYAAPVLTYVSTPLILLQDLTVKGTAQAGDRINIFLDGKPLGSTTAGDPNLAVRDGTTVRLPWFFTSPQAQRPGEHQLTVTTTSADGQTSVATDPVTVVVRGTTIEFRGRSIATFAALPIVGLGLALMMTAIAFVMTRLWMVTRRLEKREAVVDQELQELRSAVDRGRMSDEAIAEALTLIDDDVVGRRRTTKRGPRRRPRKSS